MALSPCGVSPAPSSRGSLGPDELASLGMHGRNDMSIMSRASFSSNRAGNDRARRTTGHGHSRDPRPLGERQYTIQCARMVEEFLESRGYPLDVTRRLQSSNVISSREYYDIFKFMANIRDESLRLEGSMDVEIPVAMKKWKYPFEVKKSKLQNIGAPGSWPELIAILAWVVEFIQADEPLRSLGGGGFEGSEALFLEDELGDEEKPPSNNPVPFNEKKDAYMAFLNGKDKEDIQAGFQQRIIQDVDELDREMQLLEERYQEKQIELKALNDRHDLLPLLDQERQKHNLAAERLDQEFRSTEVKTAGLLGRITEMEKELHMLLEENGRYESEVDDLQQQIKEQPLPVAEMEQLKIDWGRKRDADASLKKEISHLDCQIRDLAEQELGMEDSIRRNVANCNDALWQVKLAQPEDKRAEGQDLALKPDLTDHMEGLLSYDWQKARRHLTKVGQSLEDKSRQMEASLRDLTLEQKRTQEHLSKVEMGAARKRTQVESMRRRNGEERDRYAIDLDEHCQQADNLESSLHQLMIA